MKQALLFFHRCFDWWCCFWSEWHLLELSLWKCVYEINNCIINGNIWKYKVTFVSFWIALMTLTPKQILSLLSLIKICSSQFNFYLIFAYYFTCISIMYVLLDQSSKNNIQGVRAPFDFKIPVWIHKHSFKLLSITLRISVKRSYCTQTLQYL